MFRYLKRTFIVFLLFYSAMQVVFAGEGLTTFSNPDYMRTLNRSASVGSMDCVLFNPSGCLRLREGVYLQLGGELPIQGLSFDDVEDPDTLTSIDPEGGFSSRWVFPAMSFLYRKKKIGGFLTMTPVYNSGVKIDRIVTMLGSASRGNVAWGGSRESAGPVVASYDRKNFTYEIMGGVAWPVYRKDLLLSVAGVIMLDTEMLNINYYEKSIEDDFPMEYYKLLGFLGGTALHASLTYNSEFIDWLSVSLNVHTGGFAPATHFPTLKPSPSGLITNAKGEKKLPSSFEERPALGGIYIVKYLPMRTSIGASFDVYGKALVQVTAHVALGIRNSTMPMLKLNAEFVHYSYGFGAGFDYNVSESFVVGFGMLYKNSNAKDAVYESAVETVKDLKRQSLTIGTGIVIALRGDTLDLNISATYPLYFRSVVENEGHPDENREFQLINFRGFSKDSPGPLGADPHIWITDFSLGCGITLNF